MKTLHSITLRNTASTVWSSLQAMPNTGICAYPVFGKERDQKQSPPGMYS
jgi:hypothetical protein